MVLLSSWLTPQPNKHSYRTLLSNFKQAKQEAQQPIARNAKKIVSVIHDLAIENPIISDSTKDSHHYKVENFNAKCHRLCRAYYRHDKDDFYFFIDTATKLFMRLTKKSIFTQILEKFLQDPGASSSTPDYSKIMDFFLLDVFPTCITITIKVFDDETPYANAIFEYFTGALTVPAHLAELELFILQAIEWKVSSVASNEPTPKIQMHTTQQTSPSSPCVRTLLANTFLQTNKATTQVLKNKIGEAIGILKGELDKAILESTLAKAARERLIFLNQLQNIVAADWHALFTCAYLSTLMHLFTKAPHLQRQIYFILPNYRKTMKLTIRAKLCVNLLVALIIRTVNANSEPPRKKTRIGFSESENQLSFQEKTKIMLAQVKATLENLLEHINVSEICDELLLYTHNDDQYSREYYLNNTEKLYENANNKIPGFLDTRLDLVMAFKAKLPSPSP